MASSTYLDLPAQANPTWKAPVSTVTALPATGNTAGDGRVTLDTNLIYIWSGSAWVT
jgi:hypothetical protein